jgi:hypothetical protein
MRTLQEICLSKKIERNIFSFTHTVCENLIIQESLYHISLSVHKYDQVYFVQRQIQGPGNIN